MSYDLVIQTFDQRTYHLRRLWLDKKGISNTIFEETVNSIYAYNRIKRGNAHYYDMWRLIDYYLLVLRQPTHLQWMLKENKYIFLQQNAKQQEMIKNKRQRELEEAMKNRKDDKTLEELFINANK